MNITRSQLGVLLGYVIMFFGWLGIAYAIMAFVTWQWNPGCWSDGARVAEMIIVLILVLIHIIRTKINVVPDAQQ
jgi:hypothetical protein